MWEIEERGQKCPLFDLLMKVSNGDTFWLTEKKLRNSMILIKNVKKGKMESKYDTR